MKEHQYSPSYTGLFSFFPQSVSIITLSECQRSGVIHALLEKNTARKLYSILKYTVAGAGSASEKVMGDVCSPNWQTKLSDSGCYTVPAKI